MSIVLTELLDYWQKPFQKILQRNYSRAQQALNLKELGFDLDTVWAYLDLRPYEKREREEPEGYRTAQDHNKMEHRQSAPEVALALMWLREVKGFKVWVEYSLGANLYKVNVFTKGMGSDRVVFGEHGGQFYSSYERAESVGLDYALQYLLGERKILIQEEAGTIK